MAFKDKERAKEYAKEYYIRNKDKIKKNKKKYDLKTNYNITFEQLDKLYLEQNDCCKICNTHKDNNISHKGVLCVDHDHKTLEVRGLLCGKCNTAIGLLNDNTDLLDKAKQYLKTKGKYN